MVRGLRYPNLPTKYERADALAAMLRHHFGADPEEAAHFAWVRSFDRDDDYPEPDEEDDDDRDREDWLGELLED